ncbi:helix-turn-helix transcriptional regulator [Streptomyces sp. DSM 44915]|uniref:Helix-turn-helix transcriptional regulator n=1 Tax=Streptomyces chisholmiae TaxID=3075540 RepID=A0ABU2JQS1_9ACTN|nr:helix-turn-helix transcriptional regulator [Streptomyces sp. DSM 44915]MDT0267329.1 helix-turn-helix transcriptional regulator [Streptomyces sp. DSM 44915]
MATAALPLIGLAPSVDERGEARREDTASALYRYAVARGELGPLDLAAAELGVPVGALLVAATRLVELRLLATDEDRLVPTSPEAATDLLVSPIERAIYRRRELADRLRDDLRAVTAPGPDAAGPSAPAGGGTLTGVAEIRGLFKTVAGTCWRELVVLRPGQVAEEVLDELLDPCFEVLDRAVPTRVLAPHRSRTGFAARARATRLASAGAELRTLSEVPRAAVVFDRSLAVLISLTEQGEPTAREVRDPDVVRFLLELFEQLWADATPFGADGPGYADAADDLRQSLARMMAQGLTDEVVARRLGMSVRTCRRHIAGLLRELDAVSRFQAGVRAAGRFPLGARSPAGDAG